MAVSAFRISSRRAAGVALTLALVCGIGVTAIDSGGAAVASQTKPSEDVFAFGDAAFHGSTGTVALAHPVVGMARTPSGAGYYEVASDGGVFAFGDAAFYGSTGAIHLNRPIVGMAVTPSGHGYWLVASDGGIFAFGDAAFSGSTGAIHLNRPIVGMAATPSGHGYWLVASDGGIFAFGDAAFHGSTGGLTGVSPITAMVATPSGRGYWLAASDGGIFAFGDAAFYGSAASSGSAATITGMTATPTGRGYWLGAKNGAVFVYGDAAYYGSMSKVNLGEKTVVGIVASVSGHGYAMVATRPAPSPATANPAPTSPTSSPPSPPPHAADVPTSRRLVVTFVSSAVGHDSMVIRYYEHDSSRVLVYTCGSPHEQYANYTNGFAEIWSSVGNCAAGAHSNAFAAKFQTNDMGPDVLYLRIFYNPKVSYRFVCVNPGTVTSWTPTASYETRESSVPCIVDQSTPVTSICGGTEAPPTTYQHIVVIMNENRTWSEVGGAGFGAMPYTQDFASQCSYYQNWLETNATQDSLPQYIGLTSGVDNPAVYDDCLPSATCRSTDDNIFRQVRDAGGTPRTYVEGATGGCDGSNHPENVPALYYYGGTDHSFCTTEVRPLTEMNVNALPTFAMIIPSLCDDGHDCGNDIVDAWMRLEITRILTGASYQSGSTAIFVIYDEDRPMPNLIIAPTAHTGEITSLVASHSDALRTFESMLGLSVLPSVTSATSLRASAHL